MARFEFIGSARENSDAISANPSRLVNCYREPTGNPDFPHLIRAVPGQEAFADIARVFMRDLAYVDGVLYAACGGKLYSISEAGTHTELGDISDGETTLSGNNGNLAIAANGNYYVWDGSTLSEPDTGGDDGFTDVGSVTYLGLYTIISEKDGRGFRWSAIADPTTFDAFDVASKEGRDDDLLRPVAINGSLWLFGTNSTEIWYNTALAGGDAFARQVGGILDVGLRSASLITQYPNGAFFVGSDGRARIADGAQSAPVSTPAIEVAIEKNSLIGCTYYETRGQSMCVLTFSDRPAWCYDLATGEWHERSRGVDDGPWPVVRSVKAYGNWLTGYDTGEIRRLSKASSDLFEPLARKIVSRAFNVGGRRIKSLEIFPKMGESELGREQDILLDVGDGFLLGSGGETVLEVGEGEEARRPAKIALRSSFDGGRTWRKHGDRSLGDLGDYRQRSQWRQMGKFRSVTIELTITDNADVPIYGQAEVELL